jgi:LDH2 family malate/lactate/ureidoglycolate dehydrogenase
MSTIYQAADLVAYGRQLLESAGLPNERAQAVAEVLVEGDLLGHNTHGLQLLPPYLASLEAGCMEKEGEPEVIADRGAAVTWDARYLPGPWVITEARNLAVNRVERHGVVTVVIRKCHHIACLQAYLKAATDLGYVMLLYSSDPSVASVAPHGGTKALYTPNPMAAGFPTTNDPILLDISMSTTTNGMTMRANKEGHPLPGPWVKDSAGNPTTDAGVLFTDPPGTIYPLGGVDLGHKGFGLGILVEVLTSALGGHGRADSPTNWGSSVMLQMIDPDAFGGRSAFVRETGWFAQAVKDNPVPEGAKAARLPGEHALQRRESQLVNGVELYSGIMEGLKPWATKLKIETPPPLES